MNFSSYVMIFKLEKHLLLRKGLRRFFSSVTLKMSKGENIGYPLNKVIAVLEDFAPKHLSESWDNTGLLVEPYTPRNITKILLTNDLTEDVAQEAGNEGCEMIISYHPPIFAPLKSVVQRSWKERIISYLLENQISLYSPHTSWDCIEGGVNDWLGSGFSIAESKPIIPKDDTNMGSGRILQLSNIISLSDAISRVKQLTKLQHVRFAIGRKRLITDAVKSVALCAGSGSSVLKGIDADLYLTGEMLHHDILDATQKGISVILTNHSDSERGFLSQFSTVLHNKLDKQVAVIVSKEDKDPLITV